MRCIFVYNPNSGRGKVLNKLDYIVSRLRTVYDEVVLHESKSAQDIKDVVLTKADSFDAIIFSGGDGTFNDIASSVCRLNKRPLLGYIPTGTSNDNARNLKIPRTIKGAVKVILAQEVMHHDVGKINDDYFVYVIALGACTGTSYTTRQEAKKILGRLAYARDGINEFFQPNVNRVKIISDKGNIECLAPLVLVMNTISVGGMPFNRYGHLNDGLFDVVVINNGPGAGRINIIKFFLRGLLGFRRKKHAVCLKCSKLEIKVDGEATWCVDGERGPQGDVIIENLHDHLQIFAPKRKARSQTKRINRYNKKEEK